VPAQTSAIGMPSHERDGVAIEANLHEANRAMAVLDAHLTERPYVAGAAFTMGDIPVGAVAHRWLEIPGIERPPLAAVRAWRARLAGRPGFRTHIQLPLS
jgi:glutathione S-transferase